MAHCLAMAYGNESTSHPEIIQESELQLRVDEGIKRLL
jgi:hypothetical protein